MSNFRSYAEKAKAIAQKAFAQYHDAQAALSRAEQMRKDYPQKAFSDDEYQMKRAKAEADFRAASLEMRLAVQELQSAASQTHALCPLFQRDLDTMFAADPKALDGAALELLKSGIMQPAEFSRMFDDAKTAGNYTMMRMVCKYAAEAAEAEGQKHGADTPKARAFRAVAYRDEENDRTQFERAFELLDSVMTSCANNPLMIPSYDELTAAAYNIL